jgi:hypothetical protein
MLYSHMIRGKIDVVVDHFQSGVPQYLLQSEDISTVDEEPCGKHMPAQDVRAVPASPTFWPVWQTPT